MESKLTNSLKDGMSIAPKLMPIDFHYLNPQRNKWNIFIHKNWGSSTPAIQNLSLFGDTCDDGRNLEDAQLALRNGATVVGHNFRRVWAWAAQSTLRVHVAPVIHLSNCKYKVSMLLRNLVDLSQDRSQHLGSIVTKMSETIVLVLMLVSVGLGGAQGASSFAVATWICSSTKIFHPFEGWMFILCYKASQITISGPNSVIILISRLYSEWYWSGADLKTEFGKPCKAIELHIQNLLTIVGSIISIIGGTYVPIEWLAVNDTDGFITILDWLQPYMDWL